MTGLVLDASIAISWAMKEPATRASAAAARLLETADGVVPDIWSYEVSNILALKVRAEKLSPAERERAWDRLARMPILVQAIEPEDLRGRVSRLAIERALTVYDAAYLDLAMVRGLPLATLDGELAAAAKAEGVPLL